LKSSFLITISAAILACFLQQAWWIRGLEGAALGLTTFIALPALYKWAKSSNDFADITIECSPAVIPTKLPANGFLVVMLYPGRGGSMQGYGEEGEPTGWPPNSRAYKCMVRNLSGKPLPAVYFSLPVVYRNVNGTELEESKRFNRIKLIAHRLDESSDKPFTFYVYASGDFAATVDTIEAEYYRPDPTDPSIRIKSNLIFPMQFDGLPPEPIATPNLELREK
jgi:hypothetical protein